jgi:hypothetical protein
MSTAQSPYARYQRLCAIRQQQADADMFKAKQASNMLRLTSNRITQLRTNLIGEVGCTSGLALRARSEMNMRLEVAAQHLGLAQDNAKAKVAAISAQRLAIQQRAEGVDRLSQEWTRKVDVATDARAASANWRHSPTRKREYLA